MRGYVSKRCSLLVLEDGMKNKLMWPSCYLIELIEKDTLYVRIVKVKIRSKISRFTRNDGEVLLGDYKELDHGSNPG